MSRTKMFMRFHKAHLTERLILDHSADSQRRKRNMVEWLREVGMPADFNKLSRMFQDIKVSVKIWITKLQGPTKAQQREHSADSVSIQDPCMWGLGQDKWKVPVIHQELEDFIPEVEEFYKTNQKQKLQWHHHMSNGTVTLLIRLKIRPWGDHHKIGSLSAGRIEEMTRYSLENLRLATELLSDGGTEETCGLVMPLS